MKRRSSGEMPAPAASRTASTSLAPKGPRRIWVKTLKGGDPPARVSRQSASSAASCSPAARHDHGEGAVGAGHEAAQAGEEAALHRDVAANEVVELVDDHDEAPAGPAERLQEALDGVRRERVLATPAVGDRQRSIRGLEGAGLFEGTEHGSPEAGPVEVRVERLRVDERDEEARLGGEARPGGEVPEEPALAKAGPPMMAEELAEARRDEGDDVGDLANSAADEAVDRGRGSRSGNREVVIASLLLRRRAVATRRAGVENRRMRATGREATRGSRVVPPIIRKDRHRFASGASRAQARQDPGREVTGSRAEALQAGAWARKSRAAWAPAT